LPRSRVERAARTDLSIRRLGKLDGYSRRTERNMRKRGKARGMIAGVAFIQSGNMSDRPRTASGPLEQ
jgi:hypothetical protein